MLSSETRKLMRYEINLSNYCNYCFLGLISYILCLLIELWTLLLMSGKPNTDNEKTMIVVD